MWLRIRRWCVLRVLRLVQTSRELSTLHQDSEQDVNTSRRALLRSLLAGGAAAALGTLMPAGVGAAGSQLREEMCYGVLRNHTCCGNDDTESGRWHWHTPGHPMKGMGAPYVIDSEFLAVPRATESVGVGVPAYFVDETLDERGITLGVSGNSDKFKIRFRRNGSFISPYSSYLKGENANVWWHCWRLVEE
jgi:hypothetical protein